MASIQRRCYGGGLRLSLQPAIFGVSTGVARSAPDHIPVPGFAPGFIRSPDDAILCTLRVDCRRSTGSTFEGYRGARIGTSGRAERTDSPRGYGPESCDFRGRLPRAG